MSIVINTNMASIFTQNALTRSTWELNRSLARLSTGKRIVTSADDPSGAYYASGLDAQIRGTNVAYQNVQAGYNMISSATGDLNSINTNLERIKDLATQMANDSLNDEQIKAVQEEAKQRIEEIDRIAKESNFNKVKLLDGSKDDGTGAANSGVRLQIGANSAPSTNAIYVKGVFKDASTETGLKLFGAGADEFVDIDAAFADKDTAANFIKIVEKSSEDVTLRISTAGIYQNRLTSVSDSLLTQNQNLTGALSTVMDADVSAEAANYTKYQILQQTASAMLAQANQLPGVLALKLIGS